MSASTTIERPDLIQILPPRARRGAGRHHEPLFASGTSGRSMITDEGYGAFRSARSIRPEPIVTFGRKRMTFCFLSAKTRTTQEGEGPWEFALAKELEIDPDVAVYQMHGSQLDFEPVGSGPARRYRPDAVYWSFGSGLAMAEVKASRAWFGLEQVRAMSDRASAGLASVGIAFAEVAGDELQQDRRRAFNISRAFADRTTAFSDRQRDAVRERIEIDGGLPFGRAAEVLGVAPTAVLQTLNAMMVRRHVAYDFSTRIDADTPIVVPPPPPPGMPDVRRIGH